MGRDIKIGLDYFPVYHDFFQNKKMKALRRAHGPIGLLTYLNILCRVYDNGYYYRFDSLEELAQDIAEEIASEQLRKVAAQVTESIHYLVEHQILAEEFFKQDVLTGITMQEQYIKSMYKMKRKIKMDTYLLVDVLAVLEKIKENSEEIGFSSEEIGFSSEKSTQSKSKSKSKKKPKIKTETTTTTTTESAHAQGRNSDTAYGLQPDAESDAFVVAENHMKVWGVMRYFDENYPQFTEGVLNETYNALTEAQKFVAYNAKRGWDCLPNWKAAADLWVARLGEKGGKG